MLQFSFLGIEFDLQPLRDELKDWWAALLEILPNLMLAILVALVGWVLTRVLKKYFDKLSRRLVKDRKLAKLISSILTILVVVGFGLLVLSVLNLSGMVDKIVAAGGVAGLAFGLAFQDPLLNFFSGVILTVRNLFEVDDLIEVDGYMGVVQEITLRHTAIRTLQGQDVMIPNKIVSQSPLKNYDKLGMRRVDIACGVSYGDDLAKVKEVTIQAIKDKVAHDEGRGVQLFFNEFGGSSVNYTLRFWLDNRKTGQPDFLQAQSDAIMAIMSAYDANDIMIPFPIRTLDFGIKGGEKLSEMLGGLDRKNSSEKQNFPNGTEHRD